VCATVVSASAVLLQDRHRANAELDVRRNVLEAAGMRSPGERLAAEEVRRRFERIEIIAVDLASGRERPLSRDDRDAPTVYKVQDEDGRLRTLVLPVEGRGLWSTLRGFVALDADLTTIRGLTFYSHRETPGLGAEVDNPTWKARWKGRRAFDADGGVRIEVVKGRAGPPEQDPFHVDGLSGATVTSRGVTELLRAWLGEQGFGPYLARLRGGEA
jgi:Na+-transporting NADH:ubiquinone oxidoreductase subunit C